MKKTIFFDLGNVLIFFDPQKMYQQVADVSELSLEQVQRLMNGHADAYERGKLNSTHVHEEICRHAGKKIPFDALMHAISNIFEPNQPVITIAKKLKEKGHPLFLLSNTCEAHFAFAKKQFPFLQDFDGFILSYEVGARKGEKQIYEKALDIAGCGHEECFYTDDIPSYIESAKALQIDAELYTTPQDLSAHLYARNILIE